MFKMAKKSLLLDSWIVLMLGIKVASRLGKGKISPPRSWEEVEAQNCILLPFYLC
jgi:hypothetical protein